MSATFCYFCAKTWRQQNDYQLHAHTTNAPLSRLGPPISRSIASLGAWPPNPNGQIAGAAKRIRRKEEKNARAQAKTIHTKCLSTTRRPPSGATRATELNLCAYLFAPGWLIVLPGAPGATPPDKPQKCAHTRARLK